MSAERPWRYATVAYAAAVLALYVYGSRNGDWTMPPLYLLAGFAPVFISFGFLAVYTGEVWIRGGHFYRSRNPILYWICVAAIFFFALCLSAGGIIGLTK